MRSGGTRLTRLDRLAWAVVGLVAAVTLTQVFRWSGGFSPVAVLQALTPYLGLLLGPVAIVAFWRGRFLLVTVAVGVGFALLVVAAPLVVQRDQPPAIDGAIGLRVASANLWYQNPHVADVSDTLLAVDPDVIVFNEYTGAHQHVLQRTPLADHYLYRIDITGRGASGIALWSKHPVRVDPSPPTHVPSIDATVSGPDGDIRIVAMHMPTPMNNFDGWRADQRVAEDIARSADGPTLLIGDLNTSYWHPEFRQLLDAGFVDAHIADGEGFATSWPTTWIVPPFVQLDHALTTGGLVSTAVGDVDIPGSDHCGIVVTVAPAR